MSSENLILWLFFNKMIVFMCNTLIILINNKFSRCLAVKHRTENQEIIYLVGQIGGI